jgi:hypothetical protein
MDDLDAPVPSGLGLTAVDPNFRENPLRSSIYFATT